uniref:Uncharacterized protein LOC104238909 n=1 Tax=Nicotiana sylvestris TaxID=4096 RepID=A0A1U7XYV4_NICSY|nr:PREDICTED: uncharacterized protein LOC104238909 [Nicotiana sylvestris]
MKNRQEPPKPPSQKRTVNVISVGEVVNGVIYKVAKKVSKIIVTHGKRVRQVLGEDNITFDDADVDGVLIPHNDALMEANEKLVPKARTLSGFDNSSIVTKREIVLTIFVEGVVKDTKFQLIDMDMACNMILGRPWIYEMDVVLSTLHQVIKFHSQWGIRQIYSDKHASQSINSVADSSTQGLILFKTTIEELEGVVLFIHWPDRNVYTGTKLIPEIKGFLVSNREIEINPAQIKAIEEKPDILTSKKEVQRLTAKPKDRERLLIYLAVSEVVVSAVLVREDKVTAYPLRNILHKQELSGRLAKWAIELSEYDITYQPRTAIKSQVLADFVADFSPGMVAEAEKELQVFNGSNPVLELARELGIEQVIIKSDSQLVVNQMQGTYITREVRMQQYLEKARDLIRQIQSWKIVQIPRKENVEADALANLASTAEVTNKENASYEILPEDKKKAQALERKVARYSKTSTEETPFSLVYGVESLIPVEIGEPSTRYNQATEESNEEEIRVNLDLLEERRETTLIRMAL